MNFITGYTTLTIKSVLLFDSRIKVYPIYSRIIIIILFFILPVTIPTPFCIYIQKFEFDLTQFFQIQLLNIIIISKDTFYIIYTFFKCRLFKNIITIIILSWDHFFLLRNSCSIIPTQVWMIQLIIKWTRI